RRSGHRPTAGAAASASPPAPAGSDRTAGMNPARHPFRWLFAAALLGLAVQPALLPHPVWVQVVAGGAAGAQGYGLAAMITALARRVRAPVRPVLPLPS